MASGKGTVRELIHASFQRNGNKKKEDVRFAEGSSCIRAVESKESGGCDGQEEELL